MACVCRHSVPVQLALLTHLQLLLRVLVYISSPKDAQKILHQHSLLLLPASSPFRWPPTSFGTLLSACQQGVLLPFLPDASPAWEHFLPTLLSVCLVEGLDPAHLGFGLLLPHFPCHCLLLYLSNFTCVPSAKHRLKCVLNKYLYNERIISIY